VEESIRRKLKKIMVLAERGEAGERDVAQKMLDELLAKHDLTFEEILAGEVRDYKFSYRNKWERRLLLQLYSMVAEIMDIGEKFGIFQDRKAQAFLYEKLLKKRGNFKSCKKPELVRIFLESGVDLKGVVPEEILALNE